MPLDQGDHPDMIGSAEPLSPEETATRLRELEAWGVDLSLVEASLSRTPTERITRMLDLLQFGNALHEAYEARRVETQGDEGQHS
jgi:hypothetical protein